MTQKEEAGEGRKVMGVYIKDIKIPINCQCCFIGRSVDICISKRKITREEWNALNKRPDWCPLVEVSVPHGRLIDAEAYENYLVEMWIPANIDAIYAMPTVIEREDE